MLKFAKCPAFFLLVLAFFFAEPVNAVNSSDFLPTNCHEATSAMEASETASISQESNQYRPDPQLLKRILARKKNKRITAAILAFPFPFGIVGLHRIYLGCAPHVPVVYIATLGGAFGILPFIDFCMLVLDKNIDRYQNNDKVFMWAN